jgi:hypothetical protein
MWNKRIHDNQDRKPDARDVLYGLEEILRRWPKRRTFVLKRRLRRLKALLADDFHESDLFKIVKKPADFKLVEQTATTAVVGFVDRSTELPHRAWLARDERGEWRLHALRFLCPACFGEGVNDGLGPGPCSICEGRGWQ